MTNHIHEMRKLIGDNVGPHVTSLAGHGASSAGLVFSPASFEQNIMSNQLYLGGSTAAGHLSILQDANTIAALAPGQIGGTGSGSG